MQKTKRNRVAVISFLIVSLAQICLAKPQLERADLLRQEIKTSKTTKNIDLLFDELLAIYSKDNKFNELYNFLTTLEKNKIFRNSSILYYYMALTRFKQIQFLEENKMWEELFGNRELYTINIEKNLIKANRLSKMLEPLILKLKFLEWQVKKDDEKASFQALESLFSLAREYSQTKDDIKIIKDIADQLSSEKETNYAKRLYSVYVSGISKTDISNDELKTLADNFLKEDKIDLAISLYNVYLDKINTSQKPEDKNIIIKQMFDIADKFTHHGWQEGPDPFFAEQIYKKVESLYGFEAFDEISQYRRAYNLERTKDFESCLVEYLKLLDKFSNYQDKDRIYFRVGIINAYEFGKIDKAREYFLKVVNPVRNDISNGINNYSQSLDYLNSLYHLGLLEHWHNNLEKAKEFYNLILEKTKDVSTKPEISNLAQIRMKEIEENKEIEYNLRMFLDAVLNKKEKERFLRLELYAKAAKDYLNERVKFQTNSYFMNTGCLQEDFTYLWSGQLGTNQNPFNEYEFETSYQDLGTKVVNVVLVDSSGIVDATIEIADIYEE